MEVRGHTVPSPAVTSTLARNPPQIKLLHAIDTPVPAPTEELFAHLRRADPIIPPCTVHFQPTPIAHGFRAAPESAGRYARASGVDGLPRRNQGHGAACRPLHGGGAHPVVEPRGAIAGGRILSPRAWARVGPVRLGAFALMRKRVLPPTQLGCVYVAEERTVETGCGDPDPPVPSRRARTHPAASSTHPPGALRLAQPTPLNAAVRRAAPPSAGTQVAGSRYPRSRGSATYRDQRRVAPATPLVRPTLRVYTSPAAPAPLNAGNLPLRALDRHPEQSACMRNSSVPATRRRPTRIGLRLDSREQKRCGQSARYSGGLPTDESRVPRDAPLRHSVRARESLPSDATRRPSRFPQTEALRRSQRGIRRGGATHRSKSPATPLVQTRPPPSDSDSASA
ncbi:hypothetical protein B0H15DRAFT_950494 [Mycena belliarum]|uniref:Uncharacterized protein n=1 Tax=Mycena belliarum TaxID=1033014 RepID=A0AAD6U6N7_9AGAR|nr:hypothetical protein B0H15DRAFT_950494 [Mycena belliae]